VLADYGFNTNAIRALHSEYNDLESVDACKNIINFLNAVNGVSQLEYKTDFRTNYSGGQSVFSQLKNLETVKKVIVLGVNPRLESPILNIKIRRLVIDYGITVLVYGPLTNLNYEFEHIFTGFKAQKDVFNLELAREQTTLAVGTFHFNSLCLHSFEKYGISESIGKISISESFAKKPNLGRGYLELNLGHPNYNHDLNLTVNIFKIFLLHHVEDEMWEDRNWFGIKFPTKFYIEKASSFLSESFYYFSTITNVFGVNVRGTKEAPNIIRALLECLDVKTRAKD
jgi:hypothetical protein